MARVNKPALVDVRQDHDRVFAEDMGLATPRTIGRRATDLSKEKVEGGSPPMLTGGWQDDAAASNLADILHEQGIINNQTDQGFFDAHPITTFHDVEAPGVGVSESLDVTQEVRRYNTTTNNQDIVCTLPAISDVPAGKIFTLKRDDESGYKVTITTPDSEVIDNRATYELHGANAMVTIMSTFYDGWIIVSRSNGNTRFIEPVPALGQLMADATLVANRAYLARLEINNPMTCYSASHALGATAGAFNVDKGVYYSDGTTLYRLGSTGSVSIGGANTVTSNLFTALFNIYPGFDYYAALACDSATPTFYKFIGNSLLTDHKKKTMQFSTAFPLPSTLTISSALVTANQLWMSINDLYS